MVQLLLKSGSKVNCGSKNGLTAMHLAAQEDHIHIAEELVQYRSDTDPETKVRRGGGLLFAQH